MDGGNSSNGGFNFQPSDVNFNFTPQKASASQMAQRQMAKPRSRLGSRPAGTPRPAAGPVGDLASSQWNTQPNSFNFGNNASNASNNTGGGGSSFNFSMNAGNAANPFSFSSNPSTTFTTNTSFGSDTNNGGGSGGSFLFGQGSQTNGVQGDGSQTSRQSSPFTFGATTTAAQQQSAPAPSFNFGSGGNTLFPPSASNAGSNNGSRGSSPFGFPTTSAPQQQSSGFGQTPTTSTSTSAFGQSLTASTHNPFGQSFDTPSFGQNQQAASSSVVGQSTPAPTNSFFSNNSFTSSAPPANNAQQEAPQASFSSKFSTAESQPSTTTASGLFGQTSSSEPPKSIFSSAFTSSSTQPSTTATTSNLFSQATSAEPQKSFFPSTTPAASTAPTSNFFSQKPDATPAASTGLFGQKTDATPSSSNLFSQKNDATPAASSLFSQKPEEQSAAPTISFAPQSAAPTTPFGQKSDSSNMFGQKQEAPPATPFFGNGSAATPGLKRLFGDDDSASNPTPTKSLFAGFNKPSSTTPAKLLFSDSGATSSTASAKPLFGEGNGNSSMSPAKSGFGNVENASTPAPEKLASSSEQSVSSDAPTSSSLFGNQPTPAPAASSGFFSQSKPISTTSVSSSEPTASSTLFGGNTTSLFGSKPAASVTFPFGQSTSASQEPKGDTSSVTFTQGSLFDLAQPESPAKPMSPAQGQATRTAQEPPKETNIFKQSLSGASTLAQKPLSQPQISSQEQCDTSNLFEQPLQGQTPLSQPFAAPQKFDPSNIFRQSLQGSSLGQTPSLQPQAAVIEQPVTTPKPSPKKRKASGSVKSNGTTPSSNHFAVPYSSDEEAPAPSPRKKVMKSSLKRPLAKKASASKASTHPADAKEVHLNFLRTDPHFDIYYDWTAPMRAPRISFPGDFLTEADEQEIIQRHGAQSWPERRKREIIVGYLIQSYTDSVAAYLKDNPDEDITPHAVHFTLRREAILQRYGLGTPMDAPRTRACEDMELYLLGYEDGRKRHRLNVAYETAQAAFAQNPLSTKTPTHGSTGQSPEKPQSQPVASQASAKQNSTLSNTELVNGGKHRNDDENPDEGPQKKQKSSGTNFVSSQTTPAIIETPATPNTPATTKPASQSAPTPSTADKYGSATANTFASILDSPSTPRQSIESSSDTQKSKRKAEVQLTRDNPEEPTDNNTPKTQAPVDIKARKILKPKSRLSSVYNASDLSTPSSSAGTTPVSGAASPSSIFSQPISASTPVNNIFGHLAQSPAAGQDDSDDDDGGEETAKTPKPIGNSEQPDKATPARSLFDRISRDATPTAPTADNKESTPTPKPTGIFASLNTPKGTDNTWKPDSPLKFGTPAGSSAPGISIFGSTPAGTPAGSSAPGISIFGSTPAGVPAPAATFKFGASTSTPGSSLFPSAATSNATSAATSPAAAGSENESNDPDAEHHEQLDLTASGPGEENEEVLHTVRGRAHLYVPSEDKSKKGDWLVKGIGSLRVLKHKTTGATRILMRQDPSGTVVINKSLLAGVEYKMVNKTVQIPCALDQGEGLETWLIQIKSADAASQLVKVLEDNKPAQ